MNTWSRTELVDTLDITNARPRAWSFYWAGHIVIEPTSDGLSWSVRGERYPLPTGSVLVAPPGAGHVRVQAPAGTSFRVLFEHESAAIEPAPGRVFLPQLLARREGLKGGDALFAETVRQLHSVAPVCFRISPTVSRAQRWLASRFDASIVLRELAALLGGVDRCHLCRSFQRAVGLPPYRFRAQLRIARARQLLAGGVDCTTAALAVGFCDQSHFTRAFKAIFGATPISYVRACGARTARRELAA